MKTIEALDKLINIFQFSQQKIAFLNSFKKQAQATEKDARELDAEVQFWKSKAVLIDQQIKAGLNQLEKEAIHGQEAGPRLEKG